GGRAGGGGGSPGARPGAGRQGSAGECRDAGRLEGGGERAARSIRAWPRRAGSSALQAEGVSTQVSRRPPRREPRQGEACASSWGFSFCVDARGARVCVRRSMASRRLRGTPATVRDAACARTHAVAQQRREADGGGEQQPWRRLRN